ncbi:putative reverse transcriptase domain-containing protein, partial [Tanacetum coccineum]
MYPLTTSESSVGDSSFEDADIDMEVDVGDDVEDEVEDEVHIDRITEIETTQRQLENSQLVASEERASLVERIGILRLEYLKQLKNSLTDAWKKRWLLMRRPVSPMFSRLRIKARTTVTASRKYGNGNGGNGNGGNRNPNENNRDARLVARECTYQDFMKCQPLNFKGMEGVNSHKRTIGAEAAFAMSWRELMKLMAEVYCLGNENQKMESELRNLTVKNNDLAAYTQRFQELTMMCTKMVPEEEDRVGKFIGGLPDNIQGNGYAEKNAENKRRLEVNHRDSRGQQPPFKRPNVGGQNAARAYTAGNNERKPYNGPLPLYNKQGHYRSDCPKLKDQNRGNKAGNKNGVGEARGKAYVLGEGEGEANPDLNIVK